MRERESKWYVLPGYNFVFDLAVVLTRLSDDASVFVTALFVVCT